MDALKNWHVFVAVIAYDFSHYNVGFLNIFFRYNISFTHLNSYVKDGDIIMKTSIL